MSRCPDCGLTTYLPSLCSACTAAEHHARQVADRLAHGPIVERHRTYKRVTLVAHRSVPDERVLADAMAAAGETTSSLFGWSLDRGTVTAVATLHTD